MYVVKGLSACILDAEIHTPRAPKSEQIRKNPVITWEEDNKENQINNKLGWINFNGQKWRFCAYTEEEKEIMAKQEREKLEHMFEYILNKYGWNYAEQFYLNSSWSHKFKKNNLKIELNRPHCIYSEDKQCDILCPYFCGKCNYFKEDKNEQNNL